MVQARAQPGAMETQAETAYLDATVLWLEQLKDESYAIGIELTPTSGAWRNAEGQCQILSGMFALHVQSLEIFGGHVRPRAKIRVPAPLLTGTYTPSNSS